MRKSAILASVILSIFTACNNTSQNCDLYKIEVDGRIGYINKYGEEIISPQYIYATDFKNGLALVVTDTLFTNDYNKFRYKYNYINGKNKRLFKDDLSVKPSIVIYIVSRNDKRLITEWLDNFNFNCGLAVNQATETEGNSEILHGYIDLKGNLVIPHQYHDCSPFSENKAFVQQSIHDVFDKLEETNSSISLLEHENKWKIIDNTGKNLTEYIFSTYNNLQPFPFINNRTIGFIAINENEKLKYTANLIDENCNVIKTLPNIGEEFSNLMNNAGFFNLAELADAWKYGLDLTINDGIITQSSGALSGFGQNSKFYNANDGTYLPTIPELSNKERMEILSDSLFILDLIENNLYVTYSKGFSEGVAPCTYIRFADNNQTRGGKWFFVNKHMAVMGKKGETNVFDDAEPFSDGMAAIMNNGKWGYINRKFDLVIPCQYDIAYPFINGLAKVETNGKSLTISSYINKSGNVIWQNINYTDPQILHDDSTKN